MKQLVFLSWGNGAMFKKIGVGFMTLVTTLTMSGIGVLVPIYTAQAIAPTGIFSDGFESGSFNNWTSSDDDWHVSSGSGHAGSKKASVSDQGLSDDQLLKNISTVGYENIVLSYYYKAGQSLESNDHVYVEWWDGSLWRRLTDHASLSTGGWTVVTHTLPLGANNLSTFKFRFNASGLERASGGGDKDEFQLDDVSLTGYPIVVDTDSDGIPDSSDNCSTVANAGQEDMDADGAGDVCDSDKDGDGVGNDTDNCPVAPNADQLDSDDDGMGDACDSSDDRPDADGDGVLDANDNCPNTANPDQADADGDRVGDACDNCALTSNSGQTDDDSDGIGNSCDVYMCTYTGPEVCGDNIDNDCDGFGVSDSVEVCDGDGEPQTCEDGYVLVNDECVLEEQPVSCEETVSSYDLVSDETNTVVGGGNAFATWMPSTWITLPGSTWIWSSYEVVNPTMTEVKTFEKTFTATGTVTGASLTLATDDGYRVFVNGTEVAGDSDPEGENWMSLDVLTLNSALFVYGENTIAVEVENIGDPEAQTAQDNPAGAIYKLSLTQNACGAEPIDVCENIPEVQTEVPQGLVLEDGDQCVEPEPEPTDVCENIPEVQTEVPQGLVLEDGDQCVEPEPVVIDVCSNIDGVQEVVPEGKRLLNDECVASRGGSIYRPVGSPNVGGGLVLGAATGTGDGLPAGCGEYLSDHLRMGKNNNAEQVMKLQTFLNKHLSTNVPVTGYFGSMTYEAVKQFQLENADQILAPWVAHGLKSDKTPTGYVFKTTKRWINILECSSLDLPMPSLP